MLKSYFKMAIRSLMKNKVSSILNISGLAMGLATGIIMLQVIIDQLNYDHFNTHLRDIRLVMNNQKLNTAIYTRNGTPGPLAASLRNEIPEIKFAARTYLGGQAIFRNSNKAIYLESIYADPDFFNIMTFPVLKGNPITGLIEPGSVVLTESSARKLFGKGDPLGKSIVYNNLHNLKVAAIIRDPPQNSSNQFDAVLSFSLLNTESDWLKKWDAREVETWVQLKPNTSETLLNDKLNKLYHQKLDQKNIELFAYSFSKLNLYDRFSDGKPVGGFIDLILILSSIALLILLTACINFMNLATARSEFRAREVGIRKVMGASRKLIIIQFLSESLLMSFIALIIGIILAKIFMPGIMQISGHYFTPTFSDVRLWLLLLALGLMTGIVAGSYPAFYLSRFQPIQVLRKIMILGKGGGVLRKVLVTSQFIISIFLIIGTIVMFEQVEYIQKRPIGFNADTLVDISVNSNMGYRTDLVKNELLKVPGVKSVTGSSDNMIFFQNSFNGLEWPGKKPDQDFRIISTGVQYDWVKTIGLQLAEGRDFSSQYGTDSLSCLINETAAKRMNLGKPVGTKLGNNIVIGVVKDFVYNNPSATINPMIIYLANSDINHLFVRLSNDNNLGQSINEIGKTVKRINPNFPFEYKMTGEIYQENIDEARLYVTIAKMSGAMAIFISCLGLFGLSAFLAERRQKEIGIRKVLGASVSNLCFLMSQDFLKPVVIAFILSAPLAGWVMQKVLVQMEYHIKLSPWIFVISGSLVTFIAIFTVSYSSIKAALTNPMKSLGSE